MTTTEPITASVPLVTLEASRDRYARAAIDSALELARIAADVAEALKDGGPSAGLMMELHLLAGMVETQWAEGRSLNRLIQTERERHHDPRHT